MKNKGFTLIELMIVVAIIAIIAAIAIPNLLRARLQSNEGAAIGNLRTVVGAQTAFAAANRGYSDDDTWAELRDPTETGQPNTAPPYLDVDLSGVVQGYEYTLGVGNGVEVDPPGEVYTDFYCTAEPATDGRTGVRFFGVDASGVIREGLAALAAPGAGEPI